MSTLSEYEQNIVDEVLREWDASESMPRRAYAIDHITSWSDEHLAEPFLEQLSTRVDKLVYDDTIQWVILFQWPDETDTYIYSIKEMKWVLLEGVVFDDVRWLGKIGNHAFYGCQRNPAEYLALAMHFNDDFELEATAVHSVSEAASKDLQALAKELELTIPESD